ncbi:MAP7 domain-containing protein 1-like isoform X3 [Onthophagus taurus]|uniref:MAP7 domain-containing protein 1-like isoform X3 n=1 Tax=Onthophagus taurus TaxID=166361 RepID=UPI000C201BDB|nr:ensconsin-like isoform X3 [Onthophagus taurus]
MGTETDGRGIPSNSLEHLRSILVSSLPPENIGFCDYQVGVKLKVKANNPTAGSRPSSVAKDVPCNFLGKTMHWFAYVGPNPPDYEEDSKSRLKSVKERENEERQKKLDELKAQAQAAQRFKEKKEMERKMRLEEMKFKEDNRRQQVEERKKMMNEAERDRLEAILRRNQEREARIEAKKRNERHSMVFAFGSSTPRMLQPTDSIGSFWGHRRATSTQNITSAAAPLTRRQSERELDGGSKKRATSAGGLERSIEDMRMSSSMYEIMNWDKAAVVDRHISSTDPAATLVSPSPQVPAGCASGYVGRRRTDLMPTIPSRESPSAPSRKSFTRSPGRAYSMSRLDQLAKPRKRAELLPALAEAGPASPLRTLNRSQQSPVSRSMSHLNVNKAGPQPQRPLRKSDSRSMHQLSAVVGPLPPPRTTRAAQLRQQKLLATGSNHDAPSRPSSSLSQQSTSSITSSVNVRMRPIAAPRRPRPISIAVTGISTNGTPDPKKSTAAVEKPPLPKIRKSSLVRSTEKLKKKSVASPTDGSPKPLASPTSSQQQTTSPVEPKPLIKEKEKPTVAKEVKNDDNKPVVVAASIIATEELTVKNEIQIDNSKDLTDTTVINDNLIITDSNKVTTNSEVITESTAQITEQLVDLTLSEKEIVHKNKELIKSEEHENEKEAIEEKPIPPQKQIEKQPEKVAEKQPEKQSDKELENQSEKQTDKQSEKQSDKLSDKQSEKQSEKQLETPVKQQQTDEKIENGTMSSSTIDFGESSEMTTSMTKVRINTEEEAKAALAERRRLAREEAERQAEMERQRIAEEERIERERQQREEEQQRLLIEKLREEEEQRLQEAIKEAKKRAEEENQRREEENRMKLLKEESERRAREEAERQKAELQERLKNEEKEREARRKRVEAIMLRTRGKNNTPQQQTEEKNEENKSEKLNGSKVDTPENGHKNGKDIETVDNIIPVETLKNANNVDSLSTDDTLNSNNAWQHNTQTDLLM